MIELRDLTIGFGQRVLLDSVNARFADGSLTALIGRNGSGKSTLLRAMAGLNDSYSGEIIVDGRDIRSMSAPERARRLAVVTTQRPRIANLTCRDVVGIGRAPYTDWLGRLSEADRAAVDRALADTGMTGFADRPLDSLSDGECQRVMIARALAQDTPAILLDEPTSFLDIPNRYELVGLLRTLARDRGKMILFSTHELDIAIDMADSIALIDAGALYHLPVPDMMAAGHLRRLFTTVHFPASRLGL